MSVASQTMQRVGGWLDAQILEFWGEVQDEDGDLVVMRIWKMSSLTELDKRNSSEVDKVKRALSC